MRALLLLTITAAIFSADDTVMISLMADQQSEINGKSTKVTFSQNYILQDAWLFGQLDNLWSSSDKPQADVKVSKDDAHLSALIVRDSGEKHSFGFVMTTPDGPVYLRDTDNGDLRVTTGQKVRDILTKVGFIHVNADAARDATTDPSLKK